MRRADRAADGVGQRRRDEPRAVVGEHDRVAAVERRLDLLRERAAHRFVERPAGLAIDADDLLPRGVDAAGEDARLDRRAVLPRADDVRVVDAAVEARQQAPAFGVGARRAPTSLRPAAEGGDVVRRVARAAGDDLRRVVLQDQHRRLARHARHLAVDELVGDQIAEHEHAAAREAVDEGEEPFLALRFAGQGMD